MQIAECTVGPRRTRSNSALCILQSALRGITLIELAIVLAIVGVALFITLPTLRPSKEEASIEFAKEQLTQLIASYPKLKEIVWVQEEPRNMGAWSVMQRRMPELLPEGVELGYVGRPPRASPGEGYAVAHTKEQERIVLTALMGRADPA